MSYNPYEMEHKGLKEKISEIKDKISENKGLEKWYESFDLKSYRSKLVSLNSDKSTCEEKIELNRKNIIINKNNIKLFESKLKSRLNPVNWFDSNQKKIRNEISKREVRISKLNSDIGELSKKLKSIGNNQSATQTNISSYKNFNILNIRTETIEISKELKKLEADLVIVEEKKTSVDLKLMPIINELDKVGIKIQQSSKRLGLAEGFDTDLNNAYNSYDKAMIHEECEESLGESSPFAIIKQEKKKLKRLERDNIDCHFIW
jgi:chromosome segregation ATPase